ncbi:porin family protein [Haliangium ochraceum]|uniref:Outer membrane protein beta-barrel domain-containing protein n=1 Tax=Haliangium ochraceum (strain DSM 14365 / JCM 11303 / SMP-2) TaxID=502025 RepID=D0LZ66_HALO1|nr:porin family protein [Haliangium ochraceum]ACY16328.1 hypothetical protein Hoch_3828 [Haliangium ochraceum DSM 14365]
MKKISLFRYLSVAASVATVLLHGKIAFADLEHSTVTVGLRGGPVLSTLVRSSSTVEETPRLYTGRLHAGAAGRFSFEKGRKWGVGLRSEALWVQRGFESSRAAVFDLDYLDTNLSGELRYFFNDTINGYLSAGPRIGLLIQAHRIDANGNIQKQDQLDFFDLGFTLGMGVRLDIGNDLAFVLQGSFEQSLTNIDDKLETPGLHNRSFLCTIGVDLTVWRSE